MSSGYEALGRFIAAAIFYVVATAMIGFVLIFFAGIWVDPRTAFPYCMWIAGGFLLSGLWVIYDE